MGRNERRRRVLKEEVLSASSSHVALRAASRKTSDGDVRRYSESAGSESGLQLIDLVPRRRLSISLVAVLGLALTAGLLSLYHYVLPTVFVLGPEAVAVLDLAAPASLATWLSAAVLFVASITCLLIYTFRRHKITDYRGRYRIWLAAAAALFLLSANSVAPMHRLLGATMAYHTEWSALRADAAWWLVLCGLPLGFIAVRTILDMVESRLATSALLLAIVAYGAGLTAYLGWLPLENPSFALMTTVGATLVGHWLLLVGTMIYARHVVLDAQGLIAVREPRVRTSKAESKRKNRETSNEKPSLEETVSKLSAKTKSSEASSARSKSTQWVDGTESEREDYDEDHQSERRQRKLTKAERKRMRKLKAQDRAA